MASNCPQITVPLVLGMGLDGDPRLAGDHLVIAVTGQDATLQESASAADLGTTFPTALGLLLATEGVSNYTLAGDFRAIDLVEQAATLTLADPGSDIGIPAPLALGLLLGTTAYTLVGDHLLIPITFAPAEAFEEEAPPISFGESETFSGGWLPETGRERRKREPQAEPVHAVAPTPTELREMVAAVEPGRPKRRKRITLADVIDTREDKRRKRLQEDDEAILLLS